MPGFIGGNIGSSTHIFNVQALIIGGGGGAGWDFGGGGGAGGYRELTTTIASSRTYAANVGAGGAGGANPSGVPVAGNPSSFAGFESAGGGKGTNGSGAIQNSTPGSGGSGGGGAGWSTTNGALVGSGNTPAVTPPQGNDGGRGNFYGGSPAGGGGGGGGAGAVGNPATTSGGGPGGAGASSSITGTSVIRAGGGGGGSYSPNGGTGGAGGSGGGGAGGSGANENGVSGTENTGGGGGGSAGGGGAPSIGGNGGSGIVILRYPSRYNILMSGLVSSTSISGTEKVTTITSGTGNISFAPNKIFDGSTEQRAAPSAEFLRTEFNITTSGNYWIKPTGYSGTAKLLWCDMTNQGGGWVLIGKGRASDDNNGGWFGTNNELSVTGLRQENAFAAGISKVDQEFVNRLMNESTSGWNNSNSRNYMVVNRISNATDGFSGIGDSFYHKVTNQAQFSWVNQFGSTPNDQQIASGTGVNRRFNSTWLGGGQYGSDGSNFIDNYYGGGNDTNRLFTWHWTGHANLHGWSSGSTEFRGQMAGSEGHALQFVQLWAR